MTTVLVRWSERKIIFNKLVTVGQTILDPPSRPETDKFVKETAFNKKACSAHRRSISEGNCTKTGQKR